jgi:glucan phosphoethanolaminetransferase (alkaline phosphatase superfamily)
MKGLTTLLPLVAMYSPLIALVAAVVVFLNVRGAPEGKRRSAILFSFGALLVGSAAGAVGAAIGIGIFCTLYSSNECGLAGVFYTGPASFSFAVAAYLYWWSKRAKAP